MPSCMRAPPEADTIRSGTRLASACSMARVSFSPTTEAMLPPMNPNSKTPRTSGHPPRRALPVITASSSPVALRAVFTRSV